MKRAFFTLQLLLIPAFVALFNQQAFGVTVKTVDWAADTSTDATGTGTLDGIGVTYTTQSGLNAGISFPNPWATIAGTNAAYGGDTPEAAALGILTNGSTGQAQTISFTSAILNPILLVNYLDPNTSFTFGAPVTLLDSFNASISGNTVTAGAGANDSLNDGFAVQFLGSFNSLNFTTAGTGNVGTVSVGFTVGKEAEVPEPASMIGLLMGLSPFGIGLLHKRKQSQKSA